MKKFILPLIFISTIGTFNCSSCSKETVCAVIYAADLITEKLSILVPSIPTGIAFTITTAIKNIAETTMYCETKSAESSNTSYTTSFRENENLPWQEAQIADQNGNLQFEVFVPTSSLAPNEATGIAPEFKMNTPGQYRFTGFADGKLEVDERNETNNGGLFGEGDLQGKRMEPNNVVIITITPGPDYIPEELAEGEIPVVHFLGYSKLW